MKLTKTILKELAEAKKATIELLKKEMEEKPHMVHVNTTIIGRLYHEIDFIEQDLLEI